MNTYWISNFMYLYQIYTTIDITPTGVYRSNPKDPNGEHKRNQQRNLDTLRQVISLRAIYYKDECRLLPASSDLIQYAGLIDYFDHEVESEFNLWEFKFEVDREDIFGVNCELLLRDLNCVPIVPGLDSTVPAFPPMFITSGKCKNIAVMYQSILY